MAVTRTAPSATDYLDDETATPAVEDGWETDDENEVPETSSLIQKGWKAAKQAMSESTNFTNDFRFSAEDQIVKFLSSEPFTFKQHFLEKKSGKKSYVCLGSGCPLCRIGDTPSNKFAFPIVNLSTEGFPTQLVVAGPRLCTMLEKMDAGRQGPLEQNYYALSRTGVKSSTSYSVVPVKPRDLADDWDLDPTAVDEFLTKVEVPGPEAIYVNAKSELIEIAHDLED